MRKDESGGFAVGDWDFDDPFVRFFCNDCVPPKATYNQDRALLFFNNLLKNRLAGRNAYNQFSRMAHADRITIKRVLREIDQPHSDDDLDLTLATLRLLS